jgi:hypothetical protein
MKTIIFAVVLFSFTNLAQASVAIIANKNLSADVSEVRLKQLFTLRKDTLKGSTKKVKLYLTDNISHHKHFTEEFIGMSPKRLAKRYSKVSFAGEGQIPTTLSEQEILDKVSKSDDSLGVVNANLVTDDVKVLLLVN